MSGVLRNALCRLRPVMTPTVTQKATFVYGPPKNKISIQEKYGLFAGAVVIICGPTIWILNNVENYKKREE